MDNNGKLQRKEKDAKEITGNKPHKLCQKYEFAETKYVTIKHYMQPVKSCYAQHLYH